MLSYDFRSFLCSLDGLFFEPSEDFRFSFNENFAAPSTGSERGNFAIGRLKTQIKSYTRHEHKGRTSYSEAIFDP